MGRRLPPFAAVRAFEAAARRLSVKAAADELCLTPSAVSHKVRALEDFLDTRLFERSENRIGLTLTGDAYAGKLTRLLDWLLDETEAVRDGQRLVRALSTPGLRVEPLLASARCPVISPILRARENARGPQDLLRLTLFHDETDDGWPEWFDEAGLGGAEPPPGPTFPNCELSTTMVEQHQGVALAYDAVVRGTIACGRLERLFDVCTRPMSIYAVPCVKARADEPRIAAFRRWLRAEAEAEGMTPRGHANAAE